MEKKRMSLTLKIFIGMTLGIFFGWFFGDKISSIKIIGDIFLRLIQMAIIPLIFTGVSCAIGGLGGDMKKLGRLGYKLLIFYVGTTIIAIVIGVGIGNIFQPGTGITPPTDLLSSPVSEISAPSISEVILKMVPKNPVDAMARQDMFQMVIFSAFFGLALSMLGDAGTRILSAFSVINSAAIQMITIIMKMAPYAVFALMTWVTGTVGIEVLIPLAKYLVTLIIALILQTFVICGIVVWGIARVSPIQFYRRSLNAMIVAFTTCSSAASLPISIETAQRNLGVGKTISQFALPLGATMNSDGTAMFHAVASIMIAQFFGIEFGLTEQIMLVFFAVLIGLGGTAVPGGGMVTLAIVLNAVGLPIEGIALLAGVDRIAEMFRAVLNVTDDLSGAVAIAAWEKDFDKEVFYGRKEAVLD
ncbi:MULTISPECIES: dicarboxylate/amino acid:cation symporter [Desulfitobacterium]|uniref:Na+/H+ dicarboxylate symporter n=1 Tax=Desulfitobacterium dehalogenans (strain ATCC 51507 / DSM 9161 / JW/IU-DC1) TaxID=756499 RepID=I4A5B9_DESDJ|nr:MULTISPECIES: dicarboxylate/amino acid:cation symporter [Desulfitobacterium]AFL99153.1 Na+/H+ dicarboxylate symporter [Desulfitobacterium dehalogenans ATCC 51507]